jgi:hypothetical protein
MISVEADPAQKRAPMVGQRISSTRRLVGAAMTTTSGQSAAGRESAEEVGRAAEERAGEGEQ